MPFGGIGLELWVMDSNIRFDNFYIGTSAEEAEAFAQKTWALKRTIEDEEQKKNEPIADSTIDKVVVSEQSMRMHEERAHRHTHTNTERTLQTEERAEGGERRRALNSIV